jgi:hypothetical protein
MPFKEADRDGQVKWEMPPAGGYFFVEHGEVAEVY